MSASPARGSTLNQQWISAPPEVIYRAFTDPAALVDWFAPGDMTAVVHQFDLRPGRGYTMSLFYPSAQPGAPGKTADKEDRYTARFVVLDPPRRIVEAITFDSPDPAFQGEMSMEVSLAPERGGTLVRIAFTDIPPGIRPEDNETGTRLTLEKLARYVA